MLGYLLHHIVLVYSGSHQYLILRLLSGRQYLLKSLLRLAQSLCMAHTIPPKNQQERAYLPPIHLR